MMEDTFICLETGKHKIAEGVLSQRRNMNERKIELRKKLMHRLETEPLFSCSNSHVYRCNS